MRRDLLWKRLAEAGASDHLIRALYTLYMDAKGTVRASSGFGTVFDINLGTREGGTESPLLYSLFVFDLVQRLGSVNLEEDAVYLDGVEIRTLQFADDVGLLATSEGDIERLLEEWGFCCDDTHQKTQVKKIEMMVFTREDDAFLRIRGSGVQVPPHSAGRFSSNSCSAALICVFVLREEFAFCFRPFPEVTLLARRR